MTGPHPVPTVATPALTEADIVLARAFEAAAEAWRKTKPEPNSEIIACVAAGRAAAAHLGRIFADADMVNRLAAVAVNAARRNAPAAMRHSGSLCDDIPF